VESDNNVTTRIAENPDGNGFNYCMNAENDSPCSIDAVLKVVFK
jgi:hypothetical protein